MTEAKMKFKIIEQLQKTMEDYSINPDKWQLKELTIKEGHGYANYIHKEDINNHISERRGMEFQGFFFDENTAEIIQGNYPSFH